MMRGYRVLLSLYPASFRREYGGEMSALFERRLRQAPDTVARAGLWIVECLDVFANAALVHWDLLRQDLRYTARTLIRAPGFAITAIVVTALGVGANTAAFSVADFVMLRPLPFRDPSHLVRLWEAPPGYSTMELSPPNYRDWKTSSRSFEAMGAFHGAAANLLGEGAPRRVEGSVVTEDLLPMLGVQPLIGRLFTSAQGSDGVVLSHALWQDVFAGSREVIGRSVVLDGVPRVVLGVMPRDFHFPSRTVQFWQPMPIDQLADTDRTNNWFQVVARLRPGVTVEQARAEMTVIAANLERQYPKENEKIGATVYRLKDGFSEQSRLLLLGLCGASLCVLLIACANLANLLLARGLIRHRELVVRTALGAGRERLVRQLLTESLLLALLGGALGVLVAIASVPLLGRLVPTTLPIAQTPAVDLRILLFAALLTAATGIGFGVFPALRVSHTPDPGALREGARGGGGRKARLRGALVVVEVMASVVLLVSAGLLMRALWRIQATDPGFRADGVLTLRTALPLPRYDSVARREQFYRGVLSGVRTLPGVSSAAYISFLPMVRGGGIWPVAFPGQPETRSESNVASLRFTTPGFFATMGIPIRSGRDVAETDRADQPFVAVVSESFVRRHWPNDDPIGKRFQFGFSERTVVGVVGDIRVRGLDRSSEPQVYLPYLQVQDGSLIGYIPQDLAIRTSMPPGTLLPAIRQAVSATDPEQPISNVRTLEEIVTEETASRAVQARVLAAFAAIAFFLAAVGIHGLLSFAVSSRRHEFGVRMALGAQSGAIVAMVMRQAVLLAAAGVLPGIVLAYAAGRAMQSLLAGVLPGDAATFSATVTLCVVMTLAGSLVPVLRAVRVAPATVFRAE
ncbi:MAG: ABC transporter permease [Gemmatimonadales bacterium]